MQVALSIILGFFGLAVGSFLNVVIDRLPARQSLLVPPSHCPACQRRLTALDLIPLASFLWLRGRCRYCGARIGARSLWVELATALGFGLLYWFLRAEPSWLIAIAILYFCLLLAIAVIDLEQGLIPNRLVYPGATLALLLSLLSLHGLPTIGNLFAHQPEDIFFAVPPTGWALAGAVLGFGLFLLIALFARGGMGWGDVKMAALMGAMLGFPRILVGIFLAVVMGGLVAIALVVTHTKGRKQTVPFGPFLALGTFLALFWGQAIIRWYLQASGLS